MEPTNAAVAAAAPTTLDGGLQGGNWKSPLPYLFGGLALMLGLIGVALVLLSCSYKKPSSSSNSDSNNVVGDEEKEAASGRPAQESHSEMEPKIVVIMAGDENPTYLAEPAVSSSHQQV